ncbi:MAG: hypothetical protein AB7O73_04690 [Bacteroidia bacterium]
MEKLKKIILQTDNSVLDEIENNFRKNNSVKFLHLFTSYRDGTIEDETIRTQLNCNENSFFVLKSRLFDKIQKHLLSKSESTKTTADSSDLNLNHYLHSYPNETAIAMLQQMEKNFIETDSPYDLIHVYSALKKAHFYSDKFYSYSKQYNNQVAFLLAIERAEEILYKYNRSLANYYFSDSETEQELLFMLIKEIKNTYSLYKSRRIKLIHNIIIIQTILFANLELKDEPSVEDLLEESGEILKQFIDDSSLSHYKKVFDYLNFEYYFSLGISKKYILYFELIENNLKNFLLLNNSCLAFRFLNSRSDLYANQAKQNNISEGLSDLYFDKNDLFTEVIVKLNCSIGAYYDGDVKTAILLMNEILNEVSFKNYFFVEANIKLSLMHFYIIKKEYDMAESIIKGLSRKLLTFKGDKYKNIKQAVKLYSLVFSGMKSRTAREKFKDMYDQLVFYNTKEKKVLSSLIQEIEKLAD